jgi:6-phosphogluconate dehydrogenase
MTVGFTEEIRKALLASKIISYAQGFMLLREASEHYAWNLNFGEIAMMWREGCIIRSVFLEKIKDAFGNDPRLSNLLLDPYFQNIMRVSHQSLRKIVCHAAEIGAPTPGFMSALSFYDGYRNSSLPANLIQAQRDYFGAHTFERIDRRRGEYFHSEWSKN